MAYTTAKEPIPASMAGCRLAAGVPPDGKFEDDGLAAANDLDLEFLAFLVVDADLTAGLATGGAVMILAVLGVGVVVHCHNPSADTHA